MMSVVECVMNLSEGRNAEVMDACATAIDQGDGAVLLDRHSDPDHHRTVLTFAGSPDAVLDAAEAATRVAVERIDLSRHAGGHPRIGVVDVVPFVPISGATLADCRSLAWRYGSRVAEALELPAWFYAHASRCDPPRQLEDIRRGGRSGLESRMARDSAWHPDCGPARLHATAGAVAVGAREFLIAYNVMLRTNTLSVARAIAQRIRTSGGGLPALKAIGVPLPSRGCVQVSMNLVNFRETSLHEAYRAVEREAAAAHVEVLESELVGLIPQASIPAGDLAALKFSAWNPDQVLETRLTHCGVDTRR